MILVDTAPLIALIDAGQGEAHRRCVETYRTLSVSVPLLTTYTQSATEKRVIKNPLNPVETLHATSLQKGCTRTGFGISAVLPKQCTFSTSLKDGQHKQFYGNLSREKHFLCILLVLMSRKEYAN